MNNDEIKDEDICNLLLSRNQDGLSNILDKYSALLAYIVCNTGLTSEEDIAECISDVLFIVWRRIRKYDSSKSSFKTWLVMITRGCSIDYLRKNSKYSSTLPLHDLNDMGIDKLQSKSFALDYLLSQDIIQLLQDLPPPDNEIFYRRFILGEPVTYIATMLDMTQDSIYKRIQRGRVKLKAIMKKEGFAYG